jgi:Uma2 family endonuclease
MMGKRAAAEPEMTYDEYVRLEEASDEKHEYLRGRVVAMAGASPEHAALTASLIATLHLALRGRPCRVYSGDLRVRVDETDMTTYPDVTVVCGSLTTSVVDPIAATNPTVIVEVLSPSTEAHDRGAKFAHHRRLASLREYVLVAQDEPRVEVYRRNDTGHFELHEAGAGERIEVASLAVTLVVDELYRDPLAPS